MAKSSSDGCVGIAVVLGVVFMLGRCSVGERQPTTPVQTFASDSFATNIDAAEPLIDQMVTNIDAAAPLEAAIDAPAQAVDVPEVERQVYYSNCSEARAAGAAPVYEGEPGYAPHLDRDSDGVGCE